MIKNLCKMLHSLPQRLLQRREAAATAPLNKVPLQRLLRIGEAAALPSP